MQGVEVTDCVRGAVLGKAGQSGPTAGPIQKHLLAGAGTERDHGTSAALGTTQALAQGPRLLFRVEQVERGPFVSGWGRHQSDSGQLACPLVLRADLPTTHQSVWG